MTTVIPEELRYRKISKQLCVRFNDGLEAQLPCEYLRVHSPSAEVRGHGPGQEVLQVGKEQVGIKRIEPIGNYAVRLVFDDGHDSGLYTWQYLHELSTNQTRYWQHYLDRCEASGVVRNDSAT